MKTPRNDRRGSDLTSRSRSTAARRLRTLAGLACEPLEARKLMTGFAGAGAMLPAEMGDMNGGGGHWGNDRFNHSSDSASSDATTDTDTNGSGAMSSQMRRDFAPSGGGGGTDNDFAGRGHRGSMSDDLGGGGQDFEGHQGRAGMGAGPGMGTDMGEAPLSTQTGSSDGDQSSTGSTQLDTDLTKLQTDEQAIHDKSQVTPALMAAVRKDLEAIDKAKTGTADATALKTLQTDEQTIFGTPASQDSQTAPTAPTDAQQTQLQADHDAVLKSQGVSQTSIDQLAADRLAVKTASNVTADDQATLDADHAAIKTDRDAAQSATADSTASDTSAPATAPTAATPDTAAPAASTPAATTDLASTAPTSGDVTASASASASAPVTAAPMAATPTDPTATMMTSTATIGASHHGFRGDMGQHGRGMDHKSTEMAQTASVTNHPAGGAGSHGGGAMFRNHQGRRGMN